MPEPTKVVNPVESETLPVKKVVRPLPPVEMVGEPLIITWPPDEVPAASFFPAVRTMALFPVLLVVKLAPTVRSLSASMVRVPDPELIALLMATSPLTVAKKVAEFKSALTVKLPPLVMVKSPEPISTAELIKTSWPASKVRLLLPE